MSYKLSISKANSIRFKEVNDELPNDYNLLSCEEFGDVVYRYTQLFRNTDAIKTQVKSSTEPIVQVEGVSITPTMVKQNMGLSECLEIRIHHSNLMYMANDSYRDCSDDSVTTPHNLKGTLPSWAVAGQSFTIGAQTLTILSVAYNPELNTTAALLDANVTPSTTYIARADYDLFDFNVWEFELDMSIQVSGVPFYVTVVDEDGTTFQSENLIVTAMDELFLVDYKMSYNTDMYYTSGISNRMWLQLVKKGIEVENEIESYKADTFVKQVGAKNYEVDTFEFQPVSKELARKIVTALSHDILFINGVRYAPKESGIEQLDNTNLYTVTSSLYLYSNNNIAKDSSSVDISVPKLLISGNGSFISQ